MKATNGKFEGTWFRVSLRLTGDNLPVDEIENRLSLEPFIVGNKGEHIDGNPRYMKRNTNLWLWSNLGDSSIPFDLQISDLLEFLEPKRSELKEILSLPDVDGELILGFSSANGQGGAYLSNSLLQRVVNLGLAINLDLYPPAE